MPVFKLLERIGNFEVKDMYNTFNMGIGMIVVVNKEIADNVVTYLNNDLNEKAYIIGEIIEGKSGVDLCKI